MNRIASKRIFFIGLLGGNVSDSRRGFLRTVTRGIVAASFPALTTCKDASATVFTGRPERNQEGFLLLDNNENAHGPSGRVMAAIRASLSNVNRYSSREYRALAQDIAGSHKTESNRVILGCGSTEVLRVAAVALLGPGKKLITANPTFGDMGRYARATGAEVLEVALNGDYAHDLSTMFASVDQLARLIYICNPNNPTGSLTPRKDIEDFLARLPSSTYVLIDEAYHHYVEPSARYISFIDQPVDNPRVIVTRTFSTIYGLAGLRLGYGIADTKLVEKMEAYRTEVDLNGVAVSAAHAALADVASVRHFAKRNADDRQEFFNQAMARMLKPIDSHTNFVMLDTHRFADDVIAHFQENKILIGPPWTAFPRHIRVSLGTSSAMTEFWRVWDQMPGSKMSM
jgi:histidinol-phosphate aminotransferase